MPNTRHAAVDQPVRDRGRGAPVHHAGPRRAREDGNLIHASLHSNFLLRALAQLLHVNSFVHALSFACVHNPFSDGRSRRLCRASRSGRRPDSTNIYSFIGTFRDPSSGQHWVSLPEQFVQNGYNVGGSGKLFHVCNIVGSCRWFPRPSRHLSPCSIL